MSHQYYFPTPVLTREKSNKHFFEKDLWLNSGTNALRIGLRSAHLKPGSKVMVPLFVCQTVIDAIYAEKMSPVFVDTINEKSYWGDYLTTMQNKTADCVILVHLYGFRHPQTEFVTQFCHQRQLALIHDCAQSYGMDTTGFENDIFFYSFGPGKSSTAAGGAVIHFHSENIVTEKFPEQNIGDIIASKLFLKKRTFGYNPTITDRILSAVSFFFTANKSSIKKISAFQKKNAEKLMLHFTAIVAMRKKRFDLLLRAVNENPRFFIPYDDEKGIYFKMVIGISEKKDLERFKEYLTLNSIPFYALEVEERYKKFLKELVHTEQVNNSFIEISTESSLPMDEMNRVASFIKDFHCN